MRAFITLLIAMAATATAARPQLVCPPQFGSPEFVGPVSQSLGWDSVHVATGFVEADGATELTVMMWLRAFVQGGVPSSWDYYGYTLNGQVSTDAARATAEGGPGLPNLCSHPEGSDLVLNDGNWTETCLPSSYDCPPELTRQWGFGCYCFNLTTDTPLTLTVGGAELFVPATNGMVRSIQATSADRSCTISTAPGAHVKFGIAENPLHQFFGVQNDCVLSDSSARIADGGVVTNEWRLFVFRFKIDGNDVVSSTDTWTPADRCLKTTTIRSTMWKPRTAFARNSRFFSTVGATSGWNYKGLLKYGFKFYCGWLPDAMIERFRDQDVQEMRKRGMDL